MEAYIWSEDEFLIDFYESLNIYCAESYRNAVKIYNSEDYRLMYGEQFVPHAIFITKYIFQNIIVFTKYIKDDVMVFPAFNCMRSSIEGVRLLSVLYQDSEFRREYIENDNLDIYSSDYRFMQKRVIKILETVEQEARSKRIRVFSPSLRNNEFTKNSGLSRLHTELSKWTHMLNSNLTKTLVSTRQISLMVENDLSLEIGASYTIKRCLEGLYLLVGQFNLQQIGNEWTKELSDIELIMIDKYSKYIDRYYEKKDDAN